MTKLIEQPEHRGVIAECDLILAGDERILMGFTVAELTELAYGTDPQSKLHERLLRGIALLDEAQASEIRRSLLR